MSAVTFKVSRADANAIRAISVRAYAILVSEGLPADRLAIEMDVTAVHANGCPLKLRALLAADGANFGHDVFGISRYIDRDTGKLTRFFLPRFAVPEA